MIQQSKVPPTSLEPFEAKGDQNLNRESASAYKCEAEVEAALKEFAPVTKSTAYSSIVNQGAASIPKAGGPDATRNT